MYISAPSELQATAPNAQLLRVVADLTSLLGERERHIESLALVHRETLLRLALAAESRDGDTGVHIVRLGQIAGLLAEAVTGDRVYAERLCQAAPMHDVGKIGIPDAVLKKPGKLDEAEWQVMRRHPVIGARILGNSEHPLIRLAAEVALHHHERFDGAGYPDGLSGSAIPLSARIVAVADYYDALTMDRVYRPRVEHATVLAMLEAQAGLHFDPRIVEVFVVNAHRVAELRGRVNRRFEALSLEDEGVAAFEPMF